MKNAERQDILAQPRRMAEAVYLRVAAAREHMQDIIPRILVMINYTDKARRQISDLAPRGDRDARRDRAAAEAEAEGESKDLVRRVVLFRFV